jgi:hypothetical protein
MNLASALAVSSVCVGFVQAAPFENLGFDLANTNRVTVTPGAAFAGTGPTEDLLPGWQLFKGTVPQTTLGLNLSLLSGGYATLISADQGQYFGWTVEGSYALDLFGSAGDQDPFSLSQRGDIPADAQWLCYRYEGYPFLLDINGTELQSARQSPNSEAFDISAFRGQTVDLRLTVLGPAMPSEAGYSVVDSIAFTIPEPSTWVLISLGCLALRFAPRTTPRPPHSQHRLFQA